MGMHGGGWRSYIRYDEEWDRPEISWALLRRVAGTEPRGSVGISCTMLVSFEQAPTRLGYRLLWKSPVHVWHIGLDSQRKGDR